MHIVIIEPDAKRRQVLRLCCQQEGHTASSYESFERIPKMCGSSTHMIEGIDLLIFGPSFPDLPDIECNVKYFHVPAKTSVAVVRALIERARTKLHQLQHDPFLAFSPPTILA